MSVCYLCPTCSDVLKLSGFEATNEVGRKFCEGCGDNQDNLICVNHSKCSDKIEKKNREGLV